MKFGTDERLEERLRRWHDHLEKLRFVEEKYLLLDANKDAMFAKMFLAAPGKTNVERESAVYSSQDWVDFANGLAVAEAQYNHEKRTLELKIKAYEAEYLALKHEADAVRKVG